ncbi:LacI family DNA-binding transcriptional regulator [Novosphingobium sp.]|uniref:LacI family DNA-binding transcriptional regulator n=1 Tax=Novosphingobium sp. TaxID=1874826 RepID=UPI002610981A|nr:LacI family DNA-binding transcriptional regulator [Novosphingobium sp.]
MTEHRPRRRHSGRPTVDDVARLAGCSPMTVSRVVNGAAGVREGTREAVEAAIRKLGYAPNRAARALAGARQLRLVLLYANPSAAYLSELLIGCMDAATRQGVHLLVERCDAGRDQAKMIARFGEMAIDGLLLPPPLCDDTALLARLRRADLPAVLIGPGRAEAHHPVVMIDDYQAAHDMTRHLVALGHRRIGFVIGHPQQTASALRLAGFRDALDEAGIVIDPDFVRQGEFTYRSGLEAGMALLALTQRPTAIFAANDDMAAGCVAAAHRNRLDVPQDLTVCGFDDTAQASTIWPELTTIRQPIRTMAERALDLLVQEIKTDPGLPGPSRLLTLDYELIRRESDAPPAGA